MLTFVHRSRLRLNRKVSVRLCVWLNRRPDGRAARPKDPLKAVCTLLAGYVRMRKRAARRDPHLFGPHAQKYYQDTVRLEQDRRTLAAALDRVYGPDRDAAAATAVGNLLPVWTERYSIPPTQQRLFRKWFRETYGA